MVRANPDQPDLAELVSVMTAVERACKTISSLVRRAPMGGVLGLQEGGGSINVQGEEQKKLDVITNTVLKNALRFTGKMGVLASEEEDARRDGQRQLGAVQGPVEEGGRSSRRAAATLRSSTRSTARRTSTPTSRRARSSASTRSRVVRHVDDR